MRNAESPRTQEENVRILAEQKGYQLRRADHIPGAWHLVNPAIDDKAYSFSFTHPHSFTLDQAYELLQRKPDTASPG